MTDQMDQVVEQPRFISMPHAMLADGREICFAEYLPKETLGAYVKRNAIHVYGGALTIWHNGCLVPEGLWKGLRPKSGDLVQVRARMEGGGGGNKTLRTVATLAVALTAVSAPYLAPAAWGTLGTTAAGATFIAGPGAALTAAVMIGGSILVSPLIPERCQ